MPSAPRKRSNRPATLADVGREAGVSAMAVSAVLNGARTSTRISRETRARIREAAIKLQYRPNAAARALAQRRMNTIGVAAVINEGGEFDHYFLEAFNGVIHSAALHNQTASKRSVFGRPGRCLTSFAFTSHVSNRASSR